MATRSGRARCIRQHKHGGQGRASAGSEHAGRVPDPLGLRQVRTGSRHVLLGVDRSAEAVRALDHAIVEARARYAPLEVLQGWPWAKHAEAGPSGEGAPSLIDRAHGVLESAVERVRERAPELDVTPVLSPEPAAAALVCRGAHAALAVIGNRGPGEVTGPLADSVSLRWLSTAWARCSWCGGRGGVRPARTRHRAGGCGRRHRYGRRAVRLRTGPATGSPGSGPARQRPPGVAGRRTCRSLRSGPPGMQRECSVSGPNLIIGQGS
ncbi:universal stress protein [Streptomyces violaceusniger]|uniref:universal stress protein n=1 Tax=Streptomyces violaceusniger TaxID=68280 RepID=UPI003CD067EC